MYFIKKIFLTGAGVETSAVDFKPGLNIIYGPSETGKSYVTKCIRYLYGKDSAGIDATFGFDTIHMVLDVDGKNLTLARKLDSKKVTVSGDVPGIENGEYNTTGSKKLLGDIWLYLMGIKESQKIIVRKDYKAERFNYSSLYHMFLLDESKIDKEESVYMPSQYTKWPKTKAAILYLMTGDNFLQGHDPEDTAKAKEKRKAVEQFINRRIAQLSTKKHDLEDKYEGETPAQLNEKISEILISIESAEKEMDAAIGRSKEIAEVVVSLDDQIAEGRALQDRYKALRSHYRADVRRLTFIAEGDISESKVKHPDSCPFCGGEMEAKKKESYVEPAKAEVEKLVPKISDLQDTQDEIKKQLADMVSQREQLMSEKADIDKMVKAEMEPRISNLQKRLVEYTRAIEFYKEQEVLTEMQDEMSKELERIEEDDKTQSTFDVDAHYTSEMMSRWRDIMDSILKECNYDRYDKCWFDKSKFDVVINGHEKNTFGEGYRAFVNVVMILALQQYLNEYGTYHPDVLVFDSPILSLKERKERASEGMQASLFRYFVSNKNVNQTIVVENDLPDIDYSGANMIHFTQDEDGDGRYGFLSGVK